MKIILNNDERMVSTIYEQLRNNGGYCPCAIVHNEDTKCMCKDFREQKEEGACHCGLYIKVEDKTR